MPAAIETSESRRASVENVFSLGEALAKRGTPRVRSGLILKILLRQPELQRPLLTRSYLHKPDADVPARILPRNFGVGLQRVFCTGQFERNLERLLHFHRRVGVNLQAALAHVDEMRRDGGIAVAVQRYRHLQSRAVIAQATVENHIARGGKRAYRLLHRNRFLEGKQRASRFDGLGRWRSHDDERHGVQLTFALLQFVEKLGAAVEIAVDNEGVDFGTVEAGHGPLWFLFDGHIHVETAEDALQNADFLPIARNHHRGKSHELNLAADGTQP
jgi:hypothetical protein